MGKAARKNRGNGKGLAFLRKAVLADTDDCIPWPFYKMKNGYGQVGLHCGMMLAHRWVCEAAHGVPPEGTQAAHSCGRRDCVNPRHLRWATQSENEADKVAHGTWWTRLGGARLTEEGVRGIRGMAANGATQPEISSAFSTPISTVRKVVARRTWKHVEARQ